MDESLILALSLAEAVEADADLIGQLLREDQVARDHMIAEALQEGRPAPVDPSSYQPQLDDETYTSLRLFNVVPTTPSDTEETDSRTNLNTGADGTQDGQSTANTQAAVHTEDIQHTVGEQDIKDDTANDNRAVEAQNASALEEQSEGSITTDETVNVQSVSEEQDEVQTQDQARDNADAVLNTVETPLAPSPSPDIVSTPDMKQCVSCQDDFPDTQTFQGPCSHHWCQPCFVRCVENSLKDESLFPPRCCKPLPVESGGFISDELVDKFQQKSAEFSTVDRTYCNDTSCATFIPPQSIGGGIGYCPQCEKQTCVLCKQAQHKGICLEDTVGQEVLRLGQQQGWQRCEKCKHLIDLKIGCNHISCRCGHQFCFVCGARWRTCECPQWTENRLLDAAQDHAALLQAYAEVRERQERQRQETQRRERQRQEEEIQRQERRRREEERRREVAERTWLHPDYCHHEHFDRVEGRHECAECRQTLPSFIFECHNCDIYVCWQCLAAMRFW